MVPFSAFRALNPSAIEMKDAPINPEWIIGGAPQARAYEIFRSGDALCTFSLWDCTAGRFNWYFGVDETVQILDGEVVVTYADGLVMTLKAGDIAHFNSGTWAEWHVPNYVRKYAFCRHVIPQTIAFPLRALRKVMSLAGIRRKAQAGFAAVACTVSEIPEAAQIALMTIA